MGIVSFPGKKNMTTAMFNYKHFLMLFGRTGVLYRPGKGQRRSAQRDSGHSILPFGGVH